MEYEEHPTFWEWHVLVAAASNDSQALGLVEALSALELNVTIADTAELASHANEAAVCIIVLHPKTWQSSPSIATAMNCEPHYMLPVLAEPMLLPDASWTTDPISINAPLAMIAQELATLITRYSEITSESEDASTSIERHTTISLPQHSLEPVIQSPINKSASLWENISYKYLFLILIMLLAGNLLFNLLNHSPQMANTQATTQSSTTNDTFFTHAYTAPVPGPGCDLKGAEWQSGGQFLTLPTTTATNTSITPTQQVITDDATKTSCQKNGLLVKHDKYFDTFATVFFSYQNQALPYQFSTQITVSAVSATDTAIFTLGVRNQNSVSDYSGYGNDTINVGVDGSWTTQRTNDTTGIEEVPFTRGFVTPARTFTIEAEVNGPQITFLLNNQKVTTVIDTTYPESYGISFGMKDSNAKNPPVARFSHFVYSPLLNNYLNRAIASATAQAKQVSLMPYKASVPGFDCDKGMGQWQPGSEVRDEMTTHCLSNGLSMSQNANATYTGDVSFYWLNGNFPMNYKVQAQVNVNSHGSNCAGIMTRRDDQQGGYGFFVCSNGDWHLVRYDPINGAPYDLGKGAVNPHSSYTIEAISNGSVQKLSLDGTQIVSVNDKTFTTTDHITLSMYTYYSNMDGTVIFSNFVFTPLP